MWLAGCQRESLRLMPDWEAIVRKEGPAIWRTIWRFVRNRADAEECFQETFVSALVHSRTCHNPVLNWRGMLKRMATARAIDRLRQRTRYRNREEPADFEALS